MPKLFPWFANNEASAREYVNQRAKVVFFDNPYHNTEFDCSDGEISDQAAHGLDFLKSTYHYMESGVSIEDAARAKTHFPSVQSMVNFCEETQTAYAMKMITPDMLFFTVHWEFGMQNDNRRMLRRALSHVYSTYGKAIGSAGFARLKRGCAQFEQPKDAEQILQPVIDRGLLTIEDTVKHRHNVFGRKIVYSSRFVDETLSQAERDATYWLSRACCYARRTKAQPDIERKPSQIEILLEMMANA